MKNMLCIAAVLLVAGCVTKVSSDAEQVRIITREAAAVMKCKHLGRFSTQKSAGDGGMPSAHVDVRNKVAKAGGNALAIASQSTTPQGGGEITGDGYDCASF